jgi:hypothetical protein
MGMLARWRFRRALAPEACTRRVIHVVVIVTVVLARRTVVDVRVVHVRVVQL